MAWGSQWLFQWSKSLGGKTMRIQANIRMKRYKNRIDGRVQPIPRPPMLHWRNPPIAGRSPDHAEKLHRACIRPGDGLFAFDASVP
jgi:hypothetical protein